MFLRERTPCKQSHLDLVLPTTTMSAGGIGGLGRISRVLNGLQLIVNRSSLHHATIRTFYLQAACEGIVPLPVTTVGCVKKVL